MHLLLDLKLYHKFRITYDILKWHSMYSQLLQNLSSNNYLLKTHWQLLQITQTTSLSLPQTGSSKIWHWMIVTLQTRSILPELRQTLQCAVWTLASPVLEVESSSCVPTKVWIAAHTDGFNVGVVRKRWSIFSSTFSERFGDRDFLLALTNLGNTLL